MIVTDLSNKFNPVPKNSRKTVDKTSDNQSKKRKDKR